MKWNKEIDATKTIATILVVIGHAITAEYRTGFLGALWLVIYSFHMFLFFAISGYLFQFNLERYVKNKKQFCLKKVRQLIFPYITITIAVYSILLVSSRVPALYNMLGKPEITIPGFLQALLLNIEHYDVHLWYIYRLFFIFMINIALSKLTMRFEFLVLCIVLNLIPNFTAQYLPIAGGLIKWMIPFWVGRYVSREAKELTCNQIKGSICLGILIFGVVASYYLDNMIINDIAVGTVRRAVVQLIGLLTGITGSYLLCVFVKYIVHRRSNIVKLLAKISVYTYDIYLLHQPFIVVGTVKVLSRFNTGAISVAVAVIAGLSIPALCSKYILRRSTLARKFLLGQE